MKIQFDSELDCQRDTINSVVKGRETRQSHFTVPAINTNGQQDFVSSK